MAFDVRWMIRRDMPTVCEIERYSFEFPWTEEQFLVCLRSRDCIGMVAEYEERVVGFMIYELFKQRLHLLNFAVHPDYRRNGIGSAMLAKLARKLVDRRTSVMLEVRETNVEAQLFLKAAGFRAVRVLKGFYDESNEDAYLMQYRCVVSMDGNSGQRTGASNAP